MLRRCQVLGVTLALASLAAVQPARPADTPDRAVVFLRVIGSIELTQDQNLPRSPAAEFPGIEVATGSGFLFSPLGYVLTNYHVVRDVQATLNVDGAKVKATIKVNRIQALLPGEAGPAAPNAAPVRYEASIVASSQELDLAVLSIGGAALPFLQLGDSDAIESGDPVDAFGFPFGRDIEIGKPALPTDEMPAVSLSSGNVSAFRADEQGQRRFIQTTTALNPGNSGGPILDRDGFVVGIASRVMTGGKTPGVGFAIPINTAREFLEARGLDTLLPVRRLFLGPLQTLEGKGLRMRLPQALTDVSRRRSAVETGGSAAETVVLRIDRVLSPWSPSRLADVLAGGQVFESVVASISTPPRTRTVGARQVVLGRVSGTLGDDQVPVRMEYAVVDLGPEKIIARYLGPPNQLAFNASVLRASLASIEADPLSHETRDIALPAQWTPAAWSLPASRGPSIAVPTGWPVEPAGPSTCPGLPAPADVLSASLPTDFAVALRAAVLRGTTATVQQAAAACGGQGSVEAQTYQRRVDWLGAQFVLEGRFISTGPDELLQLEGVAPAQRSRSLPALVAQWAEQLRR
jgi:S1-C subfamily serine protease